MIDVYENCPTFENEKYILRFSNMDDAKELVNVYGDKNALPFFNSDNCHGEIFYYPDEQSMKNAIGSVELFHRVAEDDLNHVGVLRLDLESRCL